MKASQSESLLVNSFSNTNTSTATSSDDGPFLPELQNRYFIIFNSLLKFYILSIIFRSNPSMGHSHSAPVFVEVYMFTKKKKVVIQVHVFKYIIFKLET